MLFKGLISGLSPCIWFCLMLYLYPWIFLFFFGYALYGVWYGKIAIMTGAKRFISWNCRGLGNPQSIRALHNMVQRWNPKVVFLIVTKAKTRRMEGIKNKIGLANGLIVPCVGKKGGLALLWTREIDLEIKSYSLNHIDDVINDAEKNIKWRLTSFYGHPETHRRYESWHLLAFLNNQQHLSWFCLGDFNEILSNSEKSGGAIRTQQ